MEQANMDDQFFRELFSLIARHPAQVIGIVLAISGSLIFAVWTVASRPPPPSGERELAAIEAAFRAHDIDIPEDRKVVVLIDHFSKVLASQSCDECVQVELAYPHIWIIIGTPIRNSQWESIGHAEKGEVFPYTGNTFRSPEGNTYYEIELGKNTSKTALVWSEEAEVVREGENSEEDKIASDYVPKEDYELLKEQYQQVLGENERLNRAISAQRDHLSSEKRSAIQKLEELITEGQTFLTDQEQNQSFDYQDWRGRGLQELDQADRLLNLTFKAQFDKETDHSRNRPFLDAPSVKASLIILKKVRDFLKE